MMSPCQGRNQVYGIRDQRSQKVPGSGITALGSGITTRGIGISSIFHGIRDQILRVQGSKFSSFLGSVIKILSKNMGLFTINIPRYDPEMSETKHTHVRLAMKMFIEVNKLHFQGPKITSFLSSLL